MLGERLRLVLREHVDGPDARVRQVRQDEVDDPVAAAEGHGRLGAIEREREEARALAAGHDQRDEPLLSVHWWCAAIGQLNYNHFPTVCAAKIVYSAPAMTHVREAPPATDRAVAQPVVGLEPPHHQVVPRPRPRGLPRLEPQSRSRCWPASRPSGSTGSPRTRPCARASTPPTASCATTSAPRAPGPRSHAGPLRVRPVAYFSAEFGIHESLPIYSGGLGVLAGDHLKSASDLGLPLVAVGLFYRESYFRQHIDRDGWQHAEYVRSPAELLPAQPATTPARQADHHRSAALARDAAARRSGRSPSAATSSCCSTPTSTATPRRTGSSPPASTSATSASASARSCCSAWAASARCAPPASTGAACTSTRGTAPSPPSSTRAS